MKLIMESWRKYLDEQVSQTSSSGLASLLAQIQRDIKNSKAEIHSLKKPSQRLKKAEFKLEKIYKELGEINTIKACSPAAQRKTYDEYLSFMSKVAKPFSADKYREDLTFDGMFEIDGDCIEYEFSHQPNNAREYAPSLSDPDKKMPPIEGYTYYPSMWRWFLKSHPKYSPQKVNYLFRYISRHTRRAGGAEQVGHSYLEKLPENLKNLIARIGSKKSLGGIIMVSADRPHPYSFEKFKAYAMKAFNEEAKSANDNFITKKVIAGVLGENWFAHSTTAVDNACQWAWSLATGGLQENTNKTSIATYTLLKSTYYIFKQFNEIAKELKVNRMTAFSIYRNSKVEKLCKDILKTLAKGQITPRSVLLIGDSLDKMAQEFQKEYSKLPKTIKAINNLKLLALQVYRVSKLE